MCNKHVAYPSLVLSSMGASRYEALGTSDDKTVRSYYFSVLYISIYAKNIRVVRDVSIIGAEVLVGIWVHHSIAL